MNVLIIDCFDSFTFNLYQQVGALGGTPKVVTSDTPFHQIEAIPCDRIILSPGPGRPEDAGVCQEVLTTMSHHIPTLGVCLGHQAICTAYGGTVIRADRVMHGKLSPVIHDGSGLFRGLPNPLIATRYHSLIVDPGCFPKDLAITARSLDEGYVMGIKHHRYPIYGIQFHPESILTSAGDRMIQNFLAGDLT